MALKFLNKKGWHTGSLRNIETVWKAEQKHEGEQKKLEELRKQIQDERKKSEFRVMQEQAGLVPKQERLEFLYDSGLQVGKVAQADEYLLGKPLEEAVQPESEVGQVAAKPGALFVETEKPASANDNWRKLHTDPLFMIRQQEQAAIAKIKSNPVKMAEIKKAAEMKKKLKEEKKKKRKEAKRERREKKKRKKLRSSSTEDSSDSDHPRRSGKSDADVDAGRRRIFRRSPSTSPTRSPTRSPVRKDRSQSPRKSDRNAFKGQGSEERNGLKGIDAREFERRKRSPSRSPVRQDHRRDRSRRDGAFERERNGSSKGQTGTKASEDRVSERRKRAPSRSLSRSLSRSPVRRKDYGQSRSRRDDVDSRSAPKSEGRYQSSRSDHQDAREQERRPNGEDSVVGGKKLDAEEEVARRNGNTAAVPLRPMNRGGRPPKPGQLSDAERAARLAEMQANADVHEEQRWQRLKRAADDDAGEVKRSANDKTNEEFLAETQKSIFDSERASASTIEKSVKRRAHFTQRSSADNERNAFRR